MSADQQDIMSLMDGSMFSGYDTMSMNMDPNDAMTQSFMNTPNHPSGPDQTFSPSDTVVSMAGPGHMPVAAVGPSGSSATSNNLSDFTKRRNWPARVVEELKDLLHILDADGKIKHVSSSLEKLTGHKPDEVREQFLTKYLHPDDVGLFTTEFHECIASAAPLRVFYRFRKTDGEYIIFETVGHAHIAAARFAPNPQNQSPFCQAVFMMARQYPTKNSSLLDSFLEHKIENERLRRRIAELRKEEAEDLDESQRTWRQSQEGRSDITVSEDATQTGGTPTPYGPLSLQDPSMPPPDRPPSLNTALTRENLEGIAGSRPDSIREKMARYEGATQADTIEMLTGLRYLEGERSRGLTTGSGSPTLIKGDAGIAIPMDRDPRTGEKKKKVKMAEEYVCTDCGTLDSPEWRKGPKGPKTLCNACGLRWAKKEKKKSNPNSGGGMGMADGQPQMVDNLG
ncbi:blue light receptor, variant 2 [Rhypophila decipiens]